MTNTFQQIMAVVRQIPKGKVMTYGQVAEKTEILDARVVGWCLHANKDPQTPCHRVINKKGRLAPGYVFGGPEKQKEKLKKEGLAFVDKQTVDLKKHLLV